MPILSSLSFKHTSVLAKKKKILGAGWQAWTAMLEQESKGDCVWEEGAYVLQCIRQFTFLVVRKELC